MPTYDQKTDDLLAPEENAIGWPWKIFLTMATACSLVIAGYLGLRLGYQPRLEGQIAQVEQDIKDLAKDLPLEAQQKFLKFYSQVVNVDILLKTHGGLTKLFEFLEKNTNTHVVYDDVRFDAGRREFSLDGVADSYQILAEQLQAFAVAPETEKSLVSQSRLVENKVRFRMTVVVAEKFLK